MKTNVFLHIAIRIIILCTIGMLMTFIPEHLRDFFGDTIDTSDNPFRDKGTVYWNWGARHYWYYWMMVFLFILSIINFFMSIVKVINKNYPDSI
jgi:uncharacterized protein YjeT (DUF2065 family)